MRLPRFRRSPCRSLVPVKKPYGYYRSGMWLWGFNQFWALLVPGLIAFSGLSARLRDLARRLGKSWFLTVGLYVLFYLAIVFLIDLPLSYYEEFVRQHAYGLSNQTAGKWLSDSLVRLAVEMTVGFAFTWVPYLLLDRAPRRWWQITTLLAIPFLLATVLIKPIWIDPLYNKYGAMKNQALERSILALAHRAGIDGSRVFEVDMSVDTKTVNAYVTGLWGTKRIVLWDTLLRGSTNRRCWSSWPMRWGITCSAMSCVRSSCLRRFCLPAFSWSIVWAGGSLRSSHIS